MSDAGNDSNQAGLNLTSEEKRAFSYLFNQADSDQLGVVTGERAVAFFERTKVSPHVLGEIWQIADTENRGLLTKPGFCIVLRLIGHYQAGMEPTPELAFKPGPVPKFEGLQIPGAPAGGSAVSSPTASAFPPNALQPQLSGQGPIRVPPLDPQKAQQYAGLFDRSGAIQNGLLDGVTAKSIFERAGLPNEVLGKIWNLSDRQQRGALDQTEFIVAMHLLTSMKIRAMTALPSVLPPGFYEAAARRGAPPPPGARQPQGAVPRQFTGSSTSGAARAQSPLTRPPGYSTPPLSAQTTGAPWLVTSQDKAKYDQFFATIDTEGRGVINGEQAVRFFSDSRLPEETLATIWDLADINSAGQLNKDEFAVAMYLIRQQRAPNPGPLPAFLPPPLVPPSMRQQTQQTQSTAPAFDNINNVSNMPKSAADDLFGLDQPSPPQLQQPQHTGIQAQSTGASATRDPFGGSQPASPTSPQRFQTAPQQASTVFKPFMPTSQFGATLAQQNTGGSATSNQGQMRGMSQPQTTSSGLKQASAMDDLLGDNDTHAAESSKLTNETTELANMSNQIGNLRTQMEQTQTTKAATQQDLNATSTQKRDLELRLQNFRSQYEQEVRAVKELEQQLATSRESTKKLSQELAMLEGTHQDLQTQHSTVAQQLQADQKENTNLKQRIAQMNAEVTTLKPQIEKLKLDARQQKGLVSINKKQLATNESERDKLSSEKSGLEREAAEREEQARNAPAASIEDQHYGRDTAIAGGMGAAGFGVFEAARHVGGSNNVASPVPGSTVVSPAASTISSTNPFFRKASESGTLERAVSPPATGGPNPSAFDAIFGPSAAFAPTGQTESTAATPPATSFIGRAIPASSIIAPGPSMTDSIQSISSDGEPTPSATPPLPEQAKESLQNAEPPPPPANKQFHAGQLPIGGRAALARGDSPASSTRVIPPASRAGGAETPQQLDRSHFTSDESSPAVTGGFDDQVRQNEEIVPGAFPSDEEPTTAAEAKVVDAPSDPPIPASKVDDFDSAFAGFSAGEKTKDMSEHDEDPFASSSNHPPVTQHGANFGGEFPPIRSLEPENESDSDEEPERGFDDNFTAASPPRNAPAAVEEPSATNAVNSVSSSAPMTMEAPPITSQVSPPTFEESHDPSHGGTGERSGSNQFPPQFGGLLPSREDPTSPPPVVPEAPPESTAATVEKENARPTLQAPQLSGMGLSSFAEAQPSSRSDVFHDSYSRPMSSSPAVDPDPVEVPPETSQGPAASQAKNAFDDFDFDDLSEAHEGEKTGNEFEFGRQSVDEFNPAFDSPAASMMTPSHQTPVPSTRGLQQSSDSNGFANFQPTASQTSVFTSSVNANSSSIQNTPQNAQHDWDAIFSGLDNNKDVDTSFSSAAPSSDPWGAAAASSDLHTNGGAVPAERTSVIASPAPTSGFMGVPAPKTQPPLGRALTPGTEHDDPILKRLTNMGYPRGDALNALEMYDYDINRAVDHLSGN